MNEEFVSFDLAKKLKEKGFKNNCIGYYDYAGEFHYNYESDIANKEIYFCHNKYDNIWHRDLVDAPTISQVLKWLRDDKKIHIMIDIWKVDVDDIIYKWGYDIVDLTTTRVVGCDTQCANTYEQAAIAGIEYCLDNLI